ncbi:MAG: hypothetical protein WD645_01270, partial [Dehalococcoidia bacterium]
ESYLEYYDALQQAKTAFDQLTESQALLQELQAEYNPAAVERERHRERMEAFEEIDAELFESIEERNQHIRDMERDHQQRLREIQAEGQGAALGDYFGFINQMQSAAGRSMQEQVGVYSNAFAQISAAGARHNREMFEINKAAGIVNATIATYQGAAQALKDIPYPWNLAAAATVTAAGMARVSAIAGTSFGSKSAPSVSGSTAAPAVSPVDSGGQPSGRLEQQRQDVTIRVTGRRSIDQDELRAIFDGINELISDGARVGKIRLG